MGGREAGGLAYLLPRLPNREKCSASTGDGTILAGSQWTYLTKTRSERLGNYSGIRARRGWGFIGLQLLIPP